MVGPEDLLEDRQRSLVERLGGGVAALCEVQPGQLVEAGGDRGMVRSEGLFPDYQGSSVERFGLGVAALVAV